MTRRRALPLAFAALLAVTGCAGGLAAPSPSPSVAGSPSPAPSPGPSPAPPPSPSVSAAAAHGALEVDLAGAGTRTGTVDGPDGTRTFQLDLPEELAPRSPLLIALHGFTQGSAGFEQYTGLSAAATARGIVTVRPDGFGDSWNGGLACCPPATRQGIDDVGFLRALVTGLTTELELDPARVWVVGFSNGGYLALRSACEASGVVSAVVSHAGTMDLACEPTAPVSVLVSQGDRDTLIPLEGGRGPVSPQAAGRGARDVFAAWRTLDGCPEPVPRSSLAGEELIAAPCDDGTAVGLAVWTGVGHIWPADLNQLILDWLEEDAARRR